MKKRILACLTALMLCLALAACNQEEKKRRKLP